MGFTREATGLFHAEIEGLLSLGQMEGTEASKWHAGVLHAEEGKWPSEPRAHHAEEGPAGEAGAWASAGHVSWRYDMLGLPGPILGDVGPNWA